MSFYRRLFPNLRRRGDIARDREHWKLAATYYRQHLEKTPSDAAIWVQLGHALKEQGEFEDAADAYGRAYELEDDHSDTILHYAFALGRSESREGARQILIESYAYNPMESLRSQIIAMTEDRDPAWQVMGEGAIFYSVHDLLGYLKEFPTMSGIQRVQAGIALHALTQAALDSHFIVNSLMATRDTLAPGEFWLIDSDDLQAIIDYASGAKVNHARLRSMIFSAEDRATRVRPAQGNTVVLLGAFWGLGNSVQAFVPCWRAGATIGAYIYDLIPISHPQYCDPGLVRDFTMCFSEVCAIADFFLTISDFTRFVVQDFLVANGLPDVPSATVPLAHSLTGLSDAEAVLPKKLEKLEGRPFVAYVSTVEGRKNHLYVVKAWREIQLAGYDVPDLVFVGRKGWKVDDLFDLLNETDFLSGRVHIVHNLTDGELNAVYEKCLFTVFTSHVEGWGLPVGESLVHGTPCIASRSSSIPEVGGDFVDYVDPSDLEDGVTLFTRAISDPGFLAGRRERIKRDFIPRTWDVVGADFVAKVLEFSNRLAIDARHRIMRAYVPYGKLQRVNELAYPVDDLATYIHNPWRLLLSSFYQPEAMGAWMRGRYGEILLETGLAEGTQIDLHLTMLAAPWAYDSELQITVGGEPFSRDMQWNDNDTKGASIPGYDTPSMHFDGDAFRRFLLNEVRLNGGRRLRVRVGPAGLCAVHFALHGQYKIADYDPRRFAAGLSEIAFVRSDDDAGRLNLVESYFVRDLAFA